MRTPKSESFLSSIGNSIFWRGLQYASGLAKHIVIAAVIGLNGQLDAFYMCLAIMGVLVFSWAGMFDVIAVPHMIKAHQNNQHNLFKGIASGMFTFSLMSSILLGLIMYLLCSSGTLVYFAIGFEPERQQLLLDYMKWLIPVVLLHIPFRLMGAVLRTFRQFSRLYQAEFILSLFTLVSIVLFTKDRHVLLWSYSLGMVIAFFYLLVHVWKLVLPLRNPFVPDILRCLRVVPGLLILHVTNYVYVLSDSMFVSFLPKGAVSAVAYALTLVSLFPNLISIGGSFITIIAEQNSIDERSIRLNDLFSMMIYIACGITCFLLLTSEGGLQVLLERGAFTHSNTESVAVVVTAYAWMIFPMFLIGPLDQVFLMEERVNLMVRYSLLGMATNIFLNAWFLFGLDWGLFGIALATSISYWIMILSSIEGLIRLKYRLDWIRHAKWAIWIAGWMSMVYFVMRHVFSGQDESFYRVIIDGMVIVFMLIIVGLTWKGPEQLLVSKTMRRLAVSFK